MSGRSVDAFLQCFEKVESDFSAFLRVLRSLFMSTGRVRRTFFVRRRGALAFSVFFLAKTKKVSSVAVGGLCASVVSLGRVLERLRSRCARCFGPVGAFASW